MHYVTLPPYSLSYIGSDAPILPATRSVLSECSSWGNLAPSGYIQASRTIRTEGSVLFRFVTRVFRTCQFFESRSRTSPPLDFDFFLPLRRDPARGTRSRSRASIPRHTRRGRGLHAIHEVISNSEKKRFVRRALHITTHLRKIRNAARPSTSPCLRGTI